MKQADGTGEGELRSSDHDDVLPTKKEVKTDAQKEALEALYTIERFPQENAREELANQIGLSEKQVKIWFSHRRRKDRKLEGQSRLDSAPATIGLSPKSALATLPRGEGGRGNSIQEDPTAIAASLDDLDARAAAANAARAAEAAQAAIRAAQEAAQYARDVEARIKQKREEQHAKIVQKLGFSPRADGPKCALSDAEFDLLPPGAFGAKLGRTSGGKQKRAPGTLTAGELSAPAIKKQRKEIEMRQKQALKEQELARKREEMIARERAKEEARIRREHEKSVRAIERLAAEKLKREEMFERERRREEEKLEKERLKLEERRERERRRDEERIERERMKEEAKAARRVELEDRKRERDEERERERDRRERARALAALGPPEDEILELEELRVQKLRDAGHSDVVPRTALELVMCEGRHADFSCSLGDENFSSKHVSTDQLLAQHLATSMPSFPPTSVSVADPADSASYMGYVAEATHNTTLTSMRSADWPDLLEVWSFINEFSEATGCATCTLRDFTTALAKGTGSHILATVHINLLQTVLADMNEAHAQSNQTAKTNDEIQGVAATLREAWSWRFDVDAWRAHLNHMTWPEVLRQFATAAGHGKQRPSIHVSHDGKVKKYACSTAVVSSAITVKPDEDGVHDDVRVEQGNNVNKHVIDAEWVQRLGEDEYDMLTLRQRIDALKMLVHVALDGVAVRNVLDARVETASTIRKRHTAEHVTKQKTSKDVDQSDGGVYVDEYCARHALAEKIRADEEAQGTTIRHAPIGLDRRHNRYWCFTTASGRTPPAVDGSPALLYLERVFEEHFKVCTNTDSVMGNSCLVGGVDGPEWSMLDGAGAVSSLVSALDPRGRREQALYAALHARGSYIGADGVMAGSPELLGAALEAAMPTPPPPIPSLSADDNTLEVLAVRTVAADMTPRDASAPLMLAAKRGGNPPAPVALRLHKLKAEIVNTIRSLPQTAFRSAETMDMENAIAEDPKGEKDLEQVAKAATTMNDLRDVLAKLQEAIHPSFFSANFLQRCISPTFSPTTLVKDKKSNAAEHPSAGADTSGDLLPGSNPDVRTPTSFSTGERCIPATSAALALHLLSLDAALRYSPSRPPARETLAAYLYIQRPTDERGMASAMTLSKPKRPGPALKFVIKNAGKQERSTRQERRQSCTALDEEGDEDEELVSEVDEEDEENDSEEDEEEQEDESDEDFEV